MMCSKNLRRFPESSRGLPTFNHHLLKAISEASTVAMWICSLLFFHIFRDGGLKYHWKRRSHKFQSLDFCVKPHGQSTWHRPQKVGFFVFFYRAYINQYMVTMPSKNSPPLDSSPLVFLQQIYASVENGDN